MTKVSAKAELEHQNGAVTMTFEGDHDLEVVENWPDLPDDHVMIRVDGADLSGRFIIHEDDFDELMG